MKHSCLFLIHCQFEIHRHQLQIVSSKRVMHTKNEKQCTYNLTLRRVRATIVAVEKQ